MYSSIRLAEKATEFCEVAFDLAALVGQFAFVESVFLASDACPRYNRVPSSRRLSLKR